MKLNKNQKITIIIALFAMTIVILFPPVSETKAGQAHRDMLIKEHLFGSAGGYNCPVSINIKSLSLRLLAIALAGSALIIWFGLGKNEGKHK